ncbi:FG-GAP-like repeat-containing protein [Streptomyces sp. NPDC017254]|uniref:FG-GAP-like repeat-containing protein n=1 Tax=unclassified Streptomyces TaxID=2593676 RepID=UPI0037ADDA56
MNRTTHTARTLGSRGRRRALGTALAVLASSAALAATGATPAQAAEAAPKPRVAFTEYTNVDGVRHSGVVTVNVDGSDRRVLVPTGEGLPKAEITGVSYSPDGRRVAFISNDGYADIWVADADGRNAVPVRMDVDEPAGWLNGLDWTPDGKRLYLSFRARPGQDHVRIMKINVDGTGLGFLFATPEQTWDTQVDVAWDGRITFLRGSTVHIWDPRTGGAPKPVTQGLHPTFSPNGERIAFAGYFDGSNDVRARVLASGEEYSLTKGQGVMFPEWSPDGADIAYISGGTEQLATVSGATAPGGTPKVLSAPGATASDISWVPPRGWNPHGTFRRDYSGDGLADVLATDGAGRQFIYRGTGAGVLEPRREIGWGWKGYRFTAVGDFNNDGWPDVIGQDPIGALWRLDGNEYGLSNSYYAVKIGTSGWKDLKLTGVGDLTGDGFPDVLAIDTAGNLWQYAGDGRGGLQARQKAGYGYGGYRLTGVGPLTANGYQNYLGVAPNGDLYRYERGARHKIGWGWKGLTPTGVGDLTGDGVPDVLAKDTAGVLWRYDGDGKGGLKARVKAGWSYQNFTLF